MLLKLREQCPKTPTEVLLSWANVSRDSLQMLHGFSSYQLVFGRNPNLPKVMLGKPPTFTGPTTSETLEKHLLMLFMLPVNHLLKRNQMNGYVVLCIIK